MFLPLANLTADQIRTWLYACILTVLTTIAGALARWLIRVCKAAIAAKQQERKTWESIASIAPVLVEVAKAFPSMQADVAAAKTDAKVARDVSVSTETKVDSLADSMALMMQRLNVQKAPTPSAVEQALEAGHARKE